MEDHALVKLLPGGCSLAAVDRGRAVNMAVKLIRPDPAYEASHASFIAEFRQLNEELIPWVLGESRETFADYVAWLRDSSHGLNLPPGFVPHTTFWLLDAADEIVGVANLRHELNDALRLHGGHIGFGVRPSARRRQYATEMLRLALAEARCLGIGDVCVTCSRDNPASARTILNNGGELDREYYLDNPGCVVQRYWIRA